MDFRLSDDQQMLQDSVRRFVARNCRPEDRSPVTGEAPEDSKATWKLIAENGWLGVAIPENQGGFGGSLVDVTLIAHELGRVVAVDPFIWNGVFPAQLLLAAGSDAQKAALLPALIDGSRRFAVAFGEGANAGLHLSVATSSMKAAEGGYTLRGRKTLVMGGVGADIFIVSASDCDGRAGLFVVDADAPGLVRRDLLLHDGTTAQEIQLNGVDVPAAALLGGVREGRAALETGLAYAATLLCSDLVGGMESALELTARYLQDRQQFGMRLLDFQVLQHRLADMAADVEIARSMTFVGIAAVENASIEKRDQTVRQMKVLVGRTGKSVCGQCIQLHGGIGMTEEYVIGTFFKRAVVGGLLLGGELLQESSALIMAKSCGRST